MTTLPTVCSDTEDPADSMEEMIEEIERFGRLVLVQYDDDTWGAKCELMTRVKGMEAKVHSGYKHQTAINALQELCKRLKALD